MNRKPASARTLASIGLFAALVFIATSVLKVPTPTFGYIHLGDGFVLLAGFLLGPVCGGLAAGIGSGLSDLLGGYVVWAPGTFVIKFLTAFAAAHALHALQQSFRKHASAESTASGQNGAHSVSSLKAVIPAGIAGELVMVAGYFLYNIVIVMFASGSAGVGLATAAGLSLAEIPFNLIQGTAGIVLSAVLYPLFAKSFSRYHLSAS